MLVPRNVFAVAKCADTDSSRFALGGVRLERDADGKPLAIATDGRRLLAVQWPEAKPEDFPANVGDTSHVDGFATIVPVKACDEARKGLGAKLTKRHKPILSNVLIEEPAVNGVVPMVSTNLEDTRRAQPQSVDGRFPAWRDVVTKMVNDRNGSLSICVDPRMLAEMLLAMADAATTEDNCGVILTIDANTEKNKEGWRSALMVSHANTNGTTAVGLLMPMCVDGARKNENVAPTPQWLAAK